MSSSVRALRSSAELGRVSQVKGSTTTKGKVNYMIRTAKVTIKGVTPLSTSKAFTSEKTAKEQHGEFEKRTWRERAHVDENGICYMPAMAFKNSLTEAAKYLSMKIPGKRNATYTKHFEAGVFVDTHLTLGVKAVDMEGEWVFVPSDGKRGGGSRVWKCFPIFRVWSGTVDFHILDETITEDAFLEHIKAAGMYKGIGRFRPGNNGYYGRFQVVKIDWV
jgi:hypothetical protein